MIYIIALDAWIYLKFIPTKIIVIYLFNSFVVESKNITTYGSKDNLINMIWYYIF